MEENMQSKIKANFEQYKNFWILGIAIIVVAALALGTSYMRKQRALEVPAQEQVVLESCKEGDAFDIMTGKPCPQAPKPQAPAAVPGFQQAIIDYKGRSISFDEDCDATPEVLEVARGSRVLFTNVSDISMTVSFNEREVTLRPLRYFTAVVPVAGDYDVQCGPQKVAEVKAI